MKLAIMSDTHLEFDDDHKTSSISSFISTLDPDGVDVLVLAGDICTKSQIIEVMSKLCKRYEHSDVIWVHGNHEYYASDRDTIAALSREAMRQNSNLHWLDCGVITVRGQRFLGATMWFPWHVRNQQYEFFMNDFRIIKGIRDWVYDENARATAFFNSEASASDILITHHLPSKMSVAERFKHSELTSFYLTDMDEFIRTNGPKLWIHGHTHDSFDYRIEHYDTSKSTRVVCNPRGYWPSDINPDFNKALLIDV